jgi:DegV family protein with EDD domain
MEYMEKIGIITDEGADLPKEIIERYQIAVVPIKLDWPEIENLAGENTFQKMRELERRGIKSFGKTSQPSPKDFIDKYKYQLERFDKVICITLTSKHSGTYNSAIQGKNFLTPQDQEKVFVIDSLNASGGQALLVLKAIDLIKSDKKIEEIVKELEKFRENKIRLFVMIEDPKWLEASGRISPLIANLLRNMAKRGIRALMTFKNGKLVPGGIKIHAKDTVMVLFNQFEKETQKLREANKKIRMAITHGDDLESARRLKEMIGKEFKNIEVAFINIINNIVGVLAGPNALAFAWCEI